MLTEKDYCDYDTCVALKELGFPTKMTFVNEFGSIEIPINSGLIQLYEAQKFLREDKELFVNVELFGDYDRDADGKTLGTWVYYSYGILNTTTADFIREYDLCTEYQTYEEALLEGIKEAVKILKE
jgi:hypothetical protein